MLGVLGVTMAREEGFELIFSGSLSHRFLKPALKLPFVGRVGVGER